MLDGIALTGCYLEQFRLDFGDHSSHFCGRTGPEHEAVTPVFVVWLTRIFEIREDLVDCDAGEVGGQQFRLLLRVAVGPMVVVGGLDLVLRMFEQEAGKMENLVLTGSFLQFSIRPS